MNVGRINVKTIIANVIRDAQLKSVSTLIDSMIEWSYEAERFIGSTDTFVRKECEVEIKSNRAKLPNDFYQFIAFKIGDVYPEITNRDFRLFYKNSAQLSTVSVNISSNGGSSNVIKMAVENGWIHISGTSTNLKGGLAYMAFDLDDEGYPLIKDGHEPAVTAYILWKMNYARFINGKLPAGIHDRLERRWYTLCGQARGNDEMPNSKEMDYLASLHNQLLPLPNKNLF